MTFEDLGYFDELDNYILENGFDSYQIGRIIAEHKERYIVKTPTDEYNAEILGSIRYTANSRSDFPAVGDWVAITEFDDNRAIIHNILLRKSIIERQAIGKKGEKQIIGTNIDFAFIVQAIDRDFSINRIERYITICTNSNVEPIIILSKIDLIDKNELEIISDKIEQRINNYPIIKLSNETKQGLEDLKKLIFYGKTYCLLGSSGVGKSSLLNVLSGQQIMKTDSISSSTNRGKHITTHRELFIIENGGIIIDNPGMREVGITDSEKGLETTYEHIYELAKKCKFKDCSHTNESSCAVLNALENGELDPATYENYLKLQREKEYYESTVIEKRKKDRDFGKMMKNFKKSKNKNNLY
ncbi:MAG: ribosome small subunit-dependent GTPase A [Saprospiraceae bacterium]